MRGGYVPTANKPLSSSRRVRVDRQLKIRDLKILSAASVTIGHASKVGVGAHGPELQRCACAMGGPETLGKFIISHARLANSPTLHQPPHHEFLIPTIPSQSRCLT